MTSNQYNYRPAGVEQHYFPDETVDEPGPSHAPKTAPVSLLYPYAVKYDDLFLPRPELSKFSGDPLEFKLFISNFETHVESRLQDQRALLCLLVQHCTDPVKEKIQHFSEAGQNCYRLAKDRLFKEYGSPWIVSDVCEQRLKKFPLIISGDAKEMKRFAELLEKCSFIVKDIRCYSNLDSLDTLTLLVKKLPYNLRTRWVKRAVQVENRSGKLANFSHFSEFVQQESEEANSLFGLRSLNVKPSTSKVKASYTTTSFNSSNRGLKPQNRWGECWYCKSSTHRLIDCEEFIKISIDDRFEFIKRSKLCHKCFSSRHHTPQCKKVNSCTVEGCTNSFHHTLLHFTRKRSPVSKRTAPEVSNLNTDNPPENTIALSTVSKATDSDANVYLCVVPVRVRYKEKEVLKYAFLDQGSSHTFCDKTLIRSLGITGQSEKICLQTLAGSIKGYDCISCKLEISGLDGEVYYTISNVFSIDKIPV